MILRIGYIKRVAIQRHALRMVKRGRIEAAIVETDFAAADHVADRRIVKRHDHYAIVIRIGDEQLLRRRVGEYLSRKSKNGGRDSLSFELEIERPPINHRLCVESLNDS